MPSAASCSARGFLARQTARQSTDGEILPERKHDVQKKRGALRSRCRGRTWSLRMIEAAQHPGGTAAVLSHLAQSGVHHGRWGCFSKCSLCAFIVPRRGATLISEFSWSSSSKCMELHWLREKLERLLLPQKYQVTCSLILIVYRNHHTYYSRAS